MAKAQAVVHVRIVADDKSLKHLCRVAEILNELEQPWNQELTKEAQKYLKRLWRNLKVTTRGDV